MTIRCKFVCSETGESQWNPGNKVAKAKLNVVYAGSPENTKFFASTPSGTIELATLKTGLFEVGKEYYVDFTEAVPPVS